MSRILVDKLLSKVRQAHGHLFTEDYYVTEQKMYLQKLRKIVG
jgi:hypothetical protein